MNVDERVREIFTPDFIETLILVSRMTPEQLAAFMPVARHILQQDGQGKNGN